MAVVSKIKLGAAMQNYRQLEEAIWRLFCVKLVIPSKFVLFLIDIVSLD